MGRGGLYYRQTLSLPRSLGDSKQRITPKVPPETSLTSEPMTSVGSGCVTEMITSNSANLLSDIERKRKLKTWWPLALSLVTTFAFFLLVYGITNWITLPFILVGTVATAFVYFYDQLRKCVVLIYDLDGPNLTSAEQLVEAVNEIKKCDATWYLTSSGSVNDTKYHAGAKQIIERKRLKIGYRNPPFLKTNVPVPCFEFAKHAMYLLPDRLLVYEASKVGAIDYSDLKISSRPAKFIEGGTVPRDATVVGETWQFVNKRGGPDLRFRNNRRMPICQYEELEVASKTGVNEIIQLSRLGVSRVFQSAISALINGIETANAAEDLRRVQEEKHETTSDDASRCSDQGSNTEPDTPSASDRVELLFFDALCCIMIADGMASNSEKAAICKIMSIVKSGWSDAECHKRISDFLGKVKNLGFKTVLDQMLRKVLAFKRSGREEFLLKCLKFVADADGELSDREKQFLDHISDIFRSDK